LDKYNEDYAEEVKRIDEQIAKYQARIDKIVSLK